MKFKIICQNNSSLNEPKQANKDPETRPNSANKSITTQSFRQMVRNSYDYYKTCHKDDLIKQSLELIKIKQQKLKKIQLEQQKRIRAQKKQQDKERQILRQKRREKRLQTLKRKYEKEKIEATRKSQRKKTYTINYSQLEPKKSLSQFSEKDIQNDKVLFQDVICKPTKKYIEKTILQQQSRNDSVKKAHQFRNFNKVQLQLKEIGTYQLGLLHQNVLKIQEAIDTHLTFRKEMRKVALISVQELVKYVRNQGFILLNEQNFYLLTQINQDLYKLVQDDEQGLMMISVVSYRLQEILKRKQQTRQKMTQICLQELIL